MDVALTLWVILFGYILGRTYFGKRRRRHAKVFLVKRVPGASKQS